ncbi:MAG TPA: rod shape-determining protein MreC [Candidatus Angelobacter sp.]|nr:rod shape-determining protein MreC [Candidatus Angelobacter sp.]
MENFFSRYKNPLVLVVVLFLQVIALATQVKRPESGKAPGTGGTRLIRVWTATAITPFERALVSTGHFFRNTWHDYIDLHDVRKQNQELQEELARMKMEQVRLQDDADQVRRLRALLDFKERYVGQTVAAQVIGTSGNDLTRTVQIDKGSRNAHLKPDMAVITPDGIVGKVKEVYPFSSQVLLINDRESGAGVILQSSRLHGILRGSSQGFLQVNDVMSDEKVDVGEQVITSGGDKVYPKGLPVGTVTHVAPDSEGGPFLALRIKPAAHLDRLEEVLVVTEISEESSAAGDDATPHRAADILSQRLPSVQKPADANANATGAATSVVPSANRSAPSASPSPSPSATPVKKKVAPEGSVPNPAPANATPPKPKAKPTPSPSRDETTPPKADERPPGTEKPPR